MNISSLKHRTGQLILCLLLAAALGTRANVREGMTREALIELWGPPKASLSLAGHELLTFDDGREVEMRNNRIYRITGVAATSAQDHPAPPVPTVTTSRVSKYDGLVQDLNVEVHAPHPIVLAGGLVLCLLLIIAMWKCYTKAGEPGWASLVPIYNVLVMLRMAGKSPLWFLLLCIPLVQIVAAIHVDICLAHRFGKGAAFGIGLLFLPFIFYPILAFGSAEHQHPRLSREEKTQQFMQSVGLDDQA